MIVMIAKNYLIKLKILLLIFFLSNLYQSGISQEDSVNVKNKKKNIIGIECAIYSHIKNYKSLVINNNYLPENFDHFKDIYYGIRYSRNFMNKFFYKVGLGIYNLNYCYYLIPYNNDYANYEYSSDSSLIISKTLNSSTKIKELEKYIIMSFEIGKSISIVSHKLFYNISAGLSTSYKINAISKFSSTTFIKKQYLDAKNLALVNQSYETISQTDEKFDFSPKKFSFNYLSFFSISLVNSIEYHIGAKWLLSLDIPINYFPENNIYNNFFNYGVIIRGSFKF